MQISIPLPGMELMSLRRQYEQDRNQIVKRLGRYKTDSIFQVLADLAS